MKRHLWNDKATTADHSYYHPTYGDVEVIMAAATADDVGHLPPHYRGSTVYKSKCEYCGQWGQTRTACEYCGASINDKPETGTG